MIKGKVRREESYTLCAARCVHRTEGEGASNTCREDGGAGLLQPENTEMGGAEWVWSMDAVCIRCPSRVALARSYQTGTPGNSMCSEKNGKGMKHCEMKKTKS